ncbi:MAG: type VI secretion system transmembrane protein TssO [Bacteroidales bacterium]
MAQKNFKNKKEHRIGFAYVTLLFTIVTFACCWSLFYYTNVQQNVGKDFVISKMERISKFQDVQKEHMFMVDSLFSMIDSYNPSVQANYVENDINYYLKELENIYTLNKHDERYKVFAQTSTFYNMWFGDKKELWSKQSNIATFKRQLEDCQIGLDKKKNELNSKRR